VITLGSAIVLVWFGLERVESKLWNQIYIRVEFVGVRERKEEEKGREEWYEYLKAAR
jgi:hypothetical protein